MSKITENIELLLPPEPTPVELVAGGVYKGSEGRISLILENNDFRAGVRCECCTTERWVVIALNGNCVKHASAVSISSDYLMSVFTRRVGTWKGDRVEWLPGCEPNSSTESNSSTVKESLPVAPPINQRCDEDFPVAPGWWWDSFGERVELAMSSCKQKCIAKYDSWNPTVEPDGKVTGQIFHLVRRVRPEEMEEA